MRGGTLVMRGRHLSDEGEAPKCEGGGTYMK